MQPNRMMTLRTSVATDCLAASQPQFSVSPTQAGMLFHSLVAPNSDVYFEQIICRLKGDLNVIVLRQAWQEALERHEILRTSFVWEGLARPMQEVHSQVSLPFQQIDWRGFAPAEQEARLQAFVNSDRTAGFVLSEPPLFRVTLIRLADDSYQLIWSSYHALLDGWSQSLVLKEVFTTYKALTSGVEAQHEPAMPYREYIDWLAAQDFSASEQFWRDTLKGFTAPTPLGVDRIDKRRADNGLAYEETELELSAEATTALQAFARQHRLTSYTLLQGAWALLLSRYSATDDVVFGTTVSVRPYELAEIESAAGLFINTIPVRTSVTCDANVLEWLKQLQLDAVDMREHQQTALVDIQHWSEVPRGRPLFESLLVFENYPADLESWDLGEKLKVRLSNSILSRTNYPLTILAMPGPRLAFKVVFDGNRFDSVTIERMLRHLQTILAEMTGNSGRRLGDLQMLTEAERGLLLVEWNNTARDYEQALPVHQLVAKQAEQTPKAVAVVCEGEELTYQELNARANQVAHYLRRLGMGTDCLVGICLERSLEMIIGLLGTLKTGAAYVPLDPAFPGERLAFMLEDAKVPVLLTQQRLVPELPHHQATVVCLDTEWEMIARESEENPATAVAGDNLAYVIYTSGSTGKPKGVTIDHQALTNFLCAMRDQPGLRAEDVLLSVTTLSFDIAALELYLPLVTGARLVLVSRETAADGNLLKDELAASGATAVQATPATWKMLIDAGWSGSKQLKALCGGEVLSRELAGQLLELSGSLWNMYGPTETTIWSTFGKVESSAGPISIGRPIANTQIYLLDQSLQPVPVGVAGELHIGGAGLSRGYLNQPELTAKKFIRNPFVAGPAMVYKTGDLARYLPDGAIECLGRCDDQIKIRGFRIEPGEIESLLRQHESVGECVVLAREDVPGERRLVAYVVPRALEVDHKELLSVLRTTLPEYMVPSVVVKLPTLPLTLNGKVDRRALPAPDYETQVRETYIAPRTPAEELLADIWSEVLKVSRVGINDNFFELGGHSLLAVRLFAQIEKVFARRLPLATLFQAPTVKQLAQVLHQEGWLAPWSSLVAIQSGVERSSKPPLFCVHALGGNVLEFYDLARYLGSDQPFFAFQAVGLDGQQKPLMRIEDMAAHYIREMRQVQPEGPYVMAGRSFGGTVAYEMACQLREQGDEVALVALLDTYPVGYFKMDPNSDTPGYRRRRFLRRMKCHADNLKKLAVREKFDYLIEKSQFAPAKIKYGLWQMASRLFERLDRPLPSLLRSIEQFNWKAALEYVPRIYDGRVALFWASGDLTTAYDLLDGWRVLAAGGIDVHEIPGNHIDIIKEPHVRVLAQELTACLERGATEQGADGRSRRQAAGAGGRRQEQEAGSRHGDAETRGCLVEVSSVASNNLQGNLVG